MNIKGLLLLLFLMTLLKFTSLSQNFKGGLIAGLSASQVNGDTYGGYNKAGLIFGGYANKTISEKLLFQFEMIYIEKGSKKNEDIENNDLESYLISLKYIELPFMLKYKFKKNILFEGGLSLGVLIKSKEENEYGTITNSKPFNKTDLSIDFGVDYLISEKFSINMRTVNTLFFSPIRRYSSGETFWTNWGQTNCVLTLTLQYQL